MMMFQRGVAPGPPETETPKRLLTQAARAVFGTNDTLTNLLGPALTLIRSDQIDESIELLEKVASEYKRLKAENEKANASNLKT
jgi:hypothetical protein